MMDHEFEFFLYHFKGFQPPPDLLFGEDRNWKYIEDNSPHHSLRECISLPIKMYMNKIDLFHSPHYVTPPYKPCSGIVTIHDLIHLLFPEFLKNAAIKHNYAKFMMRMSAKYSKKIITVSEFSKIDIVKHLGVSPDKVKVIYNAIEEGFADIDPTDIPEKLEKCYGLKGDYILYVGNYAPHKNIERLFEAFATLIKSMEIPIKLVIVGGGKNENIEMLKNVAMKNRIDDMTVFLGNLANEELPIIYKGARAFVFPSIYEGFGIPVLESLACGTPSAIANNSSLPEVGGDAVLYFDALSVSDMVEKMVKICTDTALRSKLIAKSKDQIKKFSWKEAAFKTNALYMEVLGIS
jgi:glycosyltransferase involved in cell wall biosynthesis